MAKRKLAWITGAGGLIGHHLVQAAPRFAPDWQVRALTRAELDLTDFAQVREAFAADQPALVIHCAAMSRSPECQQQPERARRVNTDVPRLLAGLCVHSRLVFFSSDLVFDGRAGNYDESAVPHPLSVYAETKVAAERAVLQWPQHLVIRTSLNGGISPAGNRAFNEELRRAWEAGQVTRLFTDEFRSPIHASLTARAVWELVARGVRGIIHVAGAERLSRWEIGQLVAGRWPALRPQLEATSLTTYPGAPRPPDTSLNCARAQSLLSFRLLGLREWLSANPDAPF